MAKIKPITDNAEVMRKRKVETTYEYVPIIGEILGFWRKVQQNHVGESIEVHLYNSLSEYDRLFINGEEIEIPEDARTPITRD